MAWRLVSVVMAAATTMLLGCSVHMQSDRHVAFDFSDHAYYDRVYAPSPSSAAYEPLHAGDTEVARAPSRGKQAHAEGSCSDAKNEPWVDEASESSRYGER